ncbi:MAG: hypothetical protein R3303_13990 [Marinobacter sp.]|nr:hypothetical protein [Marinobacter sp.]
MEIENGRKFLIGLIETAQVSDDLSAIWYCDNGLIDCISVTVKPGGYLKYFHHYTDGQLGLCEEISEAVAISLLEAGF